MKKSSLSLSNRRLLFIVLSIPVLLLVPFTAMQFTSEVHWSFFDFALAAAMLLGTGLLFELMLRRFRSTSARLVAALLIAGVFLLVWIELAVGLLGTPLAGN